jgi:probable rRNA maturation factor
MSMVQIIADSRYPVDRKRVRSVVEKTLHIHGRALQMVVSVAIVGDRKMREMNRQFHEVDATTDVLSFPYLDPESNPGNVRHILPDYEPAILGDILISYPQAVKQAGEKKTLVDEEVDFLVAHGVEHLLGKHHE